MTINIGIVDDVASNRNILKDKIVRHGNFTVTLIAEDGKDFLNSMEHLSKDKLPSIVLMDLEMPNVDGVAAIAVGSALYPATKFLVLTIYDDDDRILDAVKAGAFGYLLKDESAENITEVLCQMHESGAGPISPSIAFKILQLVQNNQLIMVQKPKHEPSKTFFDLTTREKEILQLLVQGLQYKEIGNQLKISANTAKKHVMNIFNKLHVNSRAQAMHLALEKKLL